MSGDVNAPWPMTCANCRQPIAAGDRRLVPLPKAPDILHEVHADLTICFMALCDRLDAVERGLWVEGGGR